MIHAWRRLAGTIGRGAMPLALAAVLALSGLRPDPRDLGRQVASPYPETIVRSRTARPILEIFRQPAALTALSAMMLLATTGVLLAFAMRVPVAARRE